MWGYSRMVQGRCPCGALHAACGPPSTSIPVDSQTQEAAVGGPLKKYQVTMSSGVEAVMKLNEADAERLGGTPLEAPASTPEATAPEVLGAKRRPAAANKARTTANTKSAGGTGGAD